MEEAVKTIKNWSKNIEGTEFFEFEHPVKSVDQAIEVSGYEKDAIIKTIVASHPTGKIIVATVTADARVDFSKLDDELKSGWQMASPKKVLESTGFPVGGVPPVCINKDVVRLVDPKVLKRDYVVGGGGSTTTLLGLPPSLIVEDGAEVKKISK